MYYISYHYFGVGKRLLSKSYNEHTDLEVIRLIAEPIILPKSKIVAIPLVIELIKEAVTVPPITWTNSSLDNIIHHMLVVLYIHQ